MTPLPSSEPLSTTTTSPGMSCSSSTSCARRTHSSMFSASFRQGITTETRGAVVSACRGDRRAAVVAMHETVGGLRLLEAPRMTVCILYDCLYPFTVGGAERWYRNLALRLA